MIALRTTVALLVIAFPGDPPRRAAAQTAPDPKAELVDVTGVVIARDADGDEEPARGVVVYLDASPTLDALSQPQEATVAQKDLRFMPELLVIPRGSTVEFPNQDRVFHNVFSLSTPRRFDLGLYRDGDSRSITFERTGVIDLYCNIHPEMKARIKVVPNAFYAITDAKGRFRIRRVPTGTFTLVAWNGKEVRSPVTVAGGKSAGVRLLLEHAPGSKRHLRKDGTPYRRYR